VAVMAGNVLVFRKPKPRPVEGELAVK